jgi:hypothetical protein
MKRRWALGIAGGLTLACFVPAAAQDPAAGQDLAASQAPGVLVTATSLPAAGAYHGGTHVFLDGRATLTCSSHGSFTSSVDPPRGPGTTTIADYFATFTGELSLKPPLVPSAAVHPIAGRVHMTERIAFAERRGSVQVFDTEMVVVDLQGAGMPENVMVRESPALGSSGRTTITTLARGRYRVESYYDVWLEISLDGGKSWNRAAAPVRMSIAPAAGARRGISAGG